MRTIIKSICSSIFLISVCTFTTFAINESNINKIHRDELKCIYEKQENINGIFSIQTKEIDEDSEFFKADIKYPYLKVKQQCLYKQNIHNREIEIINKTISDDILKFKEEIKSYSKSYKEEYEKNPNKNEYTKYKYEAYTNYEVKYNKNNIISIPVVYYQFTGGAHGMSELKTYNYDLVTGQEIQLKDLFKEDCSYKDIINKEVQDNISKNPQDYFKGDDGFKGISENQKFYIEENGIVVYFGQYEIAPYSTGIPEFKIQWEKISHCLRKPLN
ncbi:MAG: DUF3298 and DUF4163 domain-containing protein [Peptostreptococcaceae bacterium]